MATRTASASSMPAPPAASRRRSSPIAASISGAVWAGGHQVSWQSTTGAVHPAYFHEADWLRSFHGGLLTTCGLQNVGLPSRGRRRQLRPARAHLQHRRAQRRPTASSSRTAAWSPRSPVRCARPTSSAPICCCAGASRCPWARPSLHVEDEVVNQGHAPAALMILYHVNLGYPGRGRRRPAHHAAG